MQRRPRHVLMIGCAGGTLATMLSRAGVRVTLVDIDPLSFEIARRYFHMPETVNCHAQDGGGFLRRTRDRYDAVILDAFMDAIIPPHLLTERFFQLVKSRLNRGGLFLVNIVVMDDDDPVPDRIARTMRKAWRQVRLLDADGFENRNAVAMGGAMRGLKRPRLLMKPAHGSRALGRSLAQLYFRPLRRERTKA